MDRYNDNKAQVDSLPTIQEIIKAFFLDEKLTQEQTEFLQANFENIQAFLDAPLNSPKDAETKKIFAKVILLAKQKGILPESIRKTLPESRPNETKEERQERIEETAETIGTTVDEGVDRIKTAYKVGKGEMAAQRVVEHFIDKTAVRISRVADKLVDKGFDWVINKGAKVIERSFPKLTPVVEVGKHLLKVVKPAVKGIVRTGIKTIAKTAKVVAKSVIHTVSSVGNSIKNFFRRIF